MTNEMKLLRAFIEARGYKIEEEYTHIDNWPERGTTETNYKVTKKQERTDCRGCPVGK